MDDRYKTHIAGISRGEHWLAQMYGPGNEAQGATASVRWSTKNFSPGTATAPSEARQIIAAFANPDATAAGHELGHVVYRQLEREDIPIVERWAGIPRDQWTPNVEEDFAKAFERYLSRGNAPNCSLAGIFG